MRTRQAISLCRGVVAPALWLIAGLLVATAEATAQPAPTDRVVARLDAGWRPASRTFASARVFTANLELGQFKTDYEIKDGGVFDSGISFRLWRNLAVGLDVSRFRSVHDARITSDLPHPFFFDLPRTTSGSVGGLIREEFDIHIRALWMMQIVDGLVISVSAGPSLINAQQDIVTSVQHAELGFPFSQIEFVGHTASRQSTTTSGLNGGIDIDGFFLHRIPFLRNIATEHVGLGLLIRYVRGSVNLQVEDQPIELDLGGLQITSGLRLRF